jgi:hypothetical protein
MKYEIETYKGQTIEYDDDYDKFICDISVEDKYKNTKRSSLKDIRKEIDTFIKINAEFKPFKAFFLSTYGDKDFDEYEVSAIRSDGKYVVSKGSYKSHFDKKDMEKCMVYDVDIVKEKEVIKNEIEASRERGRKKLNELYKKLVKMDLSKYDKFISQATETK